MRQLYLTFETLSTNQGHQDKVDSPSPNSRLQLSSIQIPTPVPTPFLMLVKLFNQIEPPSASSRILPPFSPYLLDKTLCHKLWRSSFNIQHHLSNKAILNSLNHLTPKQPFSSLQQIEPQFIQEIFLTSSLHPQENN